jgi:hypothetical protein
LHNGGPCQHASEKVFKLWKYINIRVDGDRFFSWLSDVYGVGMASRAVIGLVEMYFMGRIFI